MRRRARALAAAREFFAAREVLECETPVIVSHPVSDPQLRNVRCDLAVRPGVPYYLHTSPEYHMKRLLAAGCPDLYQICKVFRDGELGTRHLAEFTLIEWYRRQMSFDAMIAETCEFVTLDREHLGARDCRRPRACSYRELFVESASLDPLAAGSSEIRERASGAAAGSRDRGSCATASVTTGRVARSAHGRDHRAAAAPIGGLVVVDRYPGRAGRPGAPGSDAMPGWRSDSRCISTGSSSRTDTTNSPTPPSSASDSRPTGASAPGTALPDTPPDTALLAALEAGLPDCCGVALGLDRLLMACAGLAHIGDVVSFATPEDG